ncbi:MAG: sugar transferase, partial [candidate division Zixibacteria bacterium]|nr:sugar transferase [candidate division Zixibacteria bacterium]
AFRLAYWGRFELSMPFFQQDALSDIRHYQLLTTTLVPLWILLFILQGLYKPNNLLGGTREYAKIFRSSSYGLLIVIFVGFLEPTLFIARGWLILSWIFS